MANIVDLIRLYVICILVNRGAFVTILTPVQKYTRKLGEGLTLSCEFRAVYFNLFDNPIIWRKAQLDEETTVNIQGVINEPFVQTGRYRVKFTSLPPVHRFELAIKELERTDTGNYTCEIRGSGSRILGKVTQQLVVLAPVEHVFVTNSNITDGLTDMIPSELLYTEFEPGTLRCVSTGAYPAPDMRLYIGENEMDKRLNTTYNISLLGSPGLRKMEVTAECGSHRFMAQPEFDQNEVMCVALVPGLTAHTTSVKMKVNYPPKIKCESSSAYMGDRNVTLLCTVTAKPRATTVRWFIDNNGTRFDVMTSTAYWAATRIVNDTTLQAILHISTAGPSRFQTYTMIARNTVSKSRAKVQLKRKYDYRSTLQPPITGPFEETSDATRGQQDPGSHYVFIISGAKSQTFQHSSNTFLLLLTTLCVILVFLR